MEVGQLSKKVGFVIQARMESTRLPGKTLMPIPLVSDKSILSRIIDNLKDSVFNNKVVVATSTNEANNKIEDFCNKFGVHCYRGSEDDVLSRFVSINEMNNFDCIVRLTGDNPLIDIELLDKVIKVHFNNENDYTKSVGLPLGMNFEVISYEAFNRLKMVDAVDEKEHVTLHITRSEDFKKEFVTFDLDPTITNLRLTIDYPSDFIVLSTVVELVDATKLTTLSGVKEVYYNYPWVFNINTKNIQKVF